LPCSYLEFLSQPSVLPLKLLPRVQENIQARGARLHTHAIAHRDTPPSFSEPFSSPL
jgi:hypothetical protein